MNIRMLDNRILIEPMLNRDTSEGGIYVGRPTTTFVSGYEHARGRSKVEQVCCGKVLAVGPGKRHPKTGRRHAPDVAVGSYVAFSDTCHRPAGIPETDYIVIRDDDIIGVSDEPIEHFEVVNG